MVYEYSRSEKIEKCRDFFRTLSDILAGQYETIASCNQDLSQYLVPNGTAGEISYASKPALSFRISDHWNWYANLKKNPDPKYIQCWSVDIPKPGKRKAYGKASEPREGIQVAVIGGDGKYHAVFGEVYDKKLKNWRWLETDPTDIAEMVCI